MNEMNSFGEDRVKKPSVENLILEAGKVYGKAFKGLADGDYFLVFLRSIESLNYIIDAISVKFYGTIYHCTEGLKVKYSNVSEICGLDENQLISRRLGKVDTFITNHITIKEYEASERFLSEVWDVSKQLIDIVRVEQESEKSAQAEPLDPLFRSSELMFVRGEYRLSLMCLYQSLVGNAVEFEGVVRQEVGRLLDFLSPLNLKCVQNSVDDELLESILPQILESVSIVYGVTRTK